MGLLHTPALDANPLMPGVIRNRKQREVMLPPKLLNCTLPPPRKEGISAVRLWGEAGLKTKVPVWVSPPAACFAARNGCGSMCPEDSAGKYN